MDKPMVSLADHTLRFRLTFLTLLLVVTLSPIAWIFYQTLDDEELVDSISYRAYAVERSMLSLEAAVKDAQLNYSAISREAHNQTLVEEYDIFYSNIETFSSIPRSDLLTYQDEYADLSRRMEAFKDKYAQWFVPERDLTAQTALLRQVQVDLQALKPYATRLTWVADRASSRFVDERNEMLAFRQKALLGLSLLLVFGLLLFLYFSNKQLVQQARQYKTLERLNQDLVLMRTKAEAASQAKSLFLANMSHELRTPFQGIIGMLSLLKSSPLNTEQREQVDIAESSATHLFAILSDLVAVSMLETDTLQLQPIRFHLGETLQRLSLDYTERARSKNIEYKLDIASDLPSFVHADVARFEQILRALLDNAIKFTQHGECGLRVFRASQAAEGIEVQVWDTGRGIEEAQKAFIFEPFSQADNTLRRSFGGVGLGLQIAQKLTKLMGGELKLASQVGKGSVFSLVLPLPSVDEKAVEADPLVSPSLIGQPSDTLHKAQALSVLVAEDSPINRKYLEIVLHKMGHRVQFCEDGQACLDLLSRHREGRTTDAPFDLVLMDYHMPQKDGIATTQEIRQSIHPYADIKIILVTADVSPQVEQLALAAGVNRVLSKPVLEDELRQALASVTW